jgi:tetratricopeptide (TPR) repeat protein
MVVKSVIIITITIVLLIPLTIFAQSEPTCETGTELINGFCQPITFAIDDARDELESIREYNQNNEFEKALELIEQTDFPSGSWHNAILYEKYHALAKMSKHQEALEIQREWIENRSELVEFDIISFHEAVLLYHLGKYSEAFEIINSSISGINDLQGGDKQAGLVVTYFWKGMILEKMGKYDQGEQAYSTMSSVTFPSERDCVKVNNLIDFGGYTEAIPILNNMDSEYLCNENTVESLKISVQDRINMYQPIVEIAAEVEPIVCPQGFEPENDVCPDKAIVEQSNELVQKIPDWVKNIFGWYSQDQVSEDELLDAIKYLINEKILIVN